MNIFVLLENKGIRHKFLKLRTPSPKFICIKCYDLDLLNCLKESDFYPILFIGNCSIVTLYELNLAAQPAQAVPASGGRGVANLQALLK